MGAAAPPAPQPPAHLVALHGRQHGGGPLLERDALGRRQLLGQVEVHGQLLVACRQEALCGGRGRGGEEGISGGCGCSGGLQRAGMAAAMASRHASHPAPARPPTRAHARPAPAPWPGRWRRPCAPRRPHPQVRWRPPSPAPYRAQRCGRMVSSRAAALALSSGMRSGSADRKQSQSSAAAWVSRCCVQATTCRHHMAITPLLSSPAVHTHTHTPPISHLLQQRHVAVGGVHSQVEEHHAAHGRHALQGAQTRHGVAQRWVGCRETGGSGGAQ